MDTAKLRALADAIDRAESEGRKAWTAGRAGEEKKAVAHGKRMSAAYR